METLKNDELDLTADTIKKYDRKYNLHSWSAQKKIDPLVITKAEGIYFWDSTGKKYFDMSSQLVNLNIGHGNRKVIEAIKEQADKMPFMGPGYAVDVRAKLAERVIEKAPDNMDKVFFTLGGADANENAIKIAKMYTGKFKIFSRYRSYHGASFGAANLSGEPRRYTCEPGIPGFVKFFDPYIYREKIKFESEEKATEFYLGKLEEQLIYEGTDKAAAVFIETITGSNGVIIPPKGYLQGIRRLCDKYGILMICDEVMAGWGRTGEWFACNNWNVKPDIITFAKGITCGYVPLGGVLVDKKIAEYFDDNVLMCGLTYNAHPLACAAGCATLEVYEEEKLIENSRNMGAILGEKLEELKEKHSSVGDVRYIGLFSAVELVKDKNTREALVPYGKDPEGRMTKIIGMLKEKGFSTYSHENSIMIAPPLIINKEELEEALDILDDVMDSVDEYVEKLK
ncbi:aminotransferase class III-fold pyridoxal phosphate-dependent enzyme [Clostridium tyrobutyricum]|uniref:aminotransferase class III-fold pyridoxal phosphate-dependent enzyme n=1 Tax=Clostridium tyrobutyricum TaxID=1519 RepID=UPI001C38303B|nr:aminotransferase class III-fold pyridoxal phosphate-dependent enzyme [Clostridium tyrobutyricum]MBV4415502.1 aminotransferase class III-fold pyridoxal phosphate-dependent enzyme [Clostridium tyrobutyricum]MBV4424975.1 aminotransferase class III-fold pyridoxal phosphate-dependent enzyme [Clostridium tyrobutyricum]